MATKSLISFIAIIALLAAANFVGCAAAFGGRKTLTVEAPAPAPVADEEAFVALDPKDGEVAEIAKFAVAEYNNQNKDSLKFESVFSAAYTYTSKGVNYGLIIIANEGTGSHFYNANVLLNNAAKKLVALWKLDVTD